MKWKRALTRIYSLATHFTLTTFIWPIPFKSVDFVQLDILSLGGFTQHFTDERFQFWSLWQI
jgi:hypothetical protein